MNTSLYLPYPCNYYVVCDILGACPLICYLMTKSFELLGGVMYGNFFGNTCRENRIPLLKILLEYIHFIM